MAGVYLSSQYTQAEVDCTSSDVHPISYIVRVLKLDEAKRRTQMELYCGIYLHSKTISTVP